MKKIEKRKYLSPETEVVRFNVEDIITTSDWEGEFDKDPSEQGYNDPGNAVANP